MYVPNDQHPGPGSFRRQHLAMKKLLRTRAHPPSRRPHDGRPKAATIRRTGLGAAGIGGCPAGAPQAFPPPDRACSRAGQGGTGPGAGDGGRIGVRRAHRSTAAGRGDDGQAGSSAGPGRCDRLSGPSGGPDRSGTSDRVGGRISGDGPSGQWRPPKSERRSRRSGAKSETRALLLRRVCAASREVSSSISSVASAVSRCGTAGPPSTARWRSRRELVALLPQVMAGTRGLLRTVICSMSLPTRTRAPGPGRLTLSPRDDTRVSRSPD